MKRRTGETEVKMESAESFEGEVIESIEAETVKSISKPERDRDFLTEEQREKFVLDSSAEKKLMGSLDNAVESASIAAFKKYISDNPEYFGRKKENVGNLSEEQVRDIMEGDRGKVSEVASRDPIYVEMINLRDMLKDTKGNLNYDEKFMFFKRIDSTMIKDPVLLKDLREKLWEAKEGEKIDDKTVKMMMENGLAENREKHVEEKVKEYKNKELMKAMGIEKSQIIERINLEKAKGQKISDSEAKNLIIKEKKKEIEGKTSLNLSDENIIALFKEGYDLAKLELSGNIFSRALSLKFKIEGKEVSIKELKSVSKEKSSAVVEDLSNYAKKESENWDSKLKETREKIIGDSLKEIPAESAKRVYEKYKKIRLFDAAVDSKIETNKKNKKIFSEMYGDRLEELGKIADNLYDCDNLKEFKGIIGGLHDNKLEKFIMNKNLTKMAKEQGGRKRFWFEIFFNLIAEFVSSQKSSKKTP